MRACRSSRPTSRATCPASPSAGPIQGRVRQARHGDRDHDYAPDRFPVVFWDIFGEQGHPIRATVSEMGPLLLARLLELNDTQEGILNIAFRVADDNNLPVLDLKDLRALLQFVSDNASDIGGKYGNVVEGLGRHRPAPASHAGEPGRGQVPGRAGARPERLPQGRPRRTRHRQHPGRRQADGEAAPLRVVPGVDAVGAVRGAARGGRSAEAEARLLLRRGASPLQRCARSPCSTPSSRSCA